MKEISRILILTASICLLAACEKPGPAEQLGEEIDEAVEDARAGGEKLENKMDDAADEVREGVDEVAEEVEDATEGTRP